MKKLSMIGIAMLAVVAGGNELVVEPGALTPAQAVEKIRAAKSGGDKSAWTVRVKPGFYTLKESVKFTAADSGTKSSPVTWVGEGNAVFAGGAEIKGWKDHGNGVWSADLPLAPNGEKAYFEQLWVNGRRATRARLPNKGYFKIAGFNSTTQKVESANNRYVEKIGVTNEEAKIIAQIPGDEYPYAQACFIHKWNSCRRILRGFDAATGDVEVWNETQRAKWNPWTPKSTMVYFENVRSAFDEPGEWFYDAKAGKVLYRPLEGEDMTKVSVIAPSSRLSKLFVFAGNPKKEEYVHDINFKNITFAYSAPTPSGKPNEPNEAPSRQAAAYNDAAITLTGVKNIKFDGCKIMATGNYGMRFNDGCISNSVVNCTLEDLGAGGIWMGAERGYVPNGEKIYRRIIKKLTPSSNAFNLIDNCTIRRGGLYNQQGTGIVFTHVSDSKVLHCEIYDFYYTGISVGWVWGFGGSVSQRNEIGFNKIYDLGKGVMSDMGGVYTLGCSFGTTVHDNVIHDVQSYTYGGWALYTDEGSEGITMERNLCWNTTDGGFHQHFGTHNIIRNNIFAWNKMTGAIRTARHVVQDIPCSLNIINNIVIVREGPLASDGVQNVGGVWANNLWWDVSGNPKLGKGDWQKWVESGKECGGVYADPKFTDPENFDFRLKASSPAFALGFKAWDYNEAGLRK